MPLVSPAALLQDAHGAVPAFNFITFEQLWAFRDAAESQGAGVILQLSQNAIAYHSGPEAPVAAAVAAARASSAPIAVQLDHITDAALALRAPELGATSVMFDASALDYDENVATTARIAEQLHGSGIWVEAELGEVGGKDGVHDPAARTDREQAEAFAAATGVDGLAVAVGSSHAMRSTGATLDTALIARIASRVSAPLVLHGSSGVSDAQLRAAIGAGISKVNVGTRFNVLFTERLRAALGADAAEVDPRKYLRPARQVMAAEAARILGVCAGRP
ncbi:MULTISPECIES: class II fructose-bisphosphate aldolase [Microbacterium]|uniref:class II fructose-bisphosphate aldolase n=1 Tax=Microbacterium TaxID=33882 RepID=UPI0020982C96|nr:class II fructose-bisphosphate aldolase [Microbacterium aurugineum]MCK8475846.1 class II fructose-bisphosphate aldolase [Microbacterium aurugineum]